MKQVTNRIVTITLALVALTALPILAAPAGVVNINEAAEEQLILLPRIGPALAVRIVEFRNTNGDFESTEELMLVRGIGERTYEGLEALVVTTGETTLQESVPVSRPAKPTDEDKSSQ